MIRESITGRFKSFCLGPNTNKNVYEIILSRGAAYTGIYPWEGLLPQRIEHTVLMYSTAYNLWTFTWFVHFELPFRLKRTDKIHTEGLSKFHSNLYSILFGFYTF